MKPLPILNCDQLLDFCKIDPNLHEIRQYVGLDKNIFDDAFQPAIKCFVELVQLAPASESHHHACPGGLIIHTLDVMALALKKRKGYQLPIGGSIHEIGLQRHLWTYAVFVGCLLHDIGKLSSSTRLIGIRKDGSEFCWTPQSGPLTEIDRAKSYRIEFRKTPYQYHARLALTHWSLIPENGRTWLIEAGHIMSELTAWLWGDRYESGMIGEIIEYADRESTAKNLQLPPGPRFSNQIPAIDRYIKLIRTLLNDNLIKVNVNGGMGWVDHDGYLYLVCRSLAERLIHECNQLGLRNLPQDPVRVWDILQEHGYAITNDAGKAIWTIEVKTESFSHQFTCLKFESRKFSTPAKLLSPLSGEIRVLAGNNDTNTSAALVTEKLETVENLAPVTHETAGGAETGTKDFEKQENAEESAESKFLGPEVTPESIKGTDPNDGQGETAEAAALQKSETAEGPNLQGISVIQNLDYEGPETARKFLGWLQRSILERTLVLNSTQSEVHIVEEGVFLLAPAIFKTFLRLHNLEENKHNNLSKRFARLRKHIRNGDLNIHTYWVKGNNRATAIKGWVIPFNVIYEADAEIPAKNKYVQKVWP